ncbi:MAG TPA: lytic transglycosylase F [Candidatus Sulfomarinibacteraceae bacterium]|nr:lytic transglycosylase F [Candidatus Sulfomarinibacteraceae bacterium]
MNKGRMLGLVAVLATIAVVSCARPDDEGEAERRQPTRATGAAGEVAPAAQPATEGGGEGQLELAAFDSELGSLAEFRGDLDEIAARGVVRALVTYSKTHYFLDGATQRGLTYEGLREFETFLNRRLGRTTLRVRVLIIPVHRDELLPTLERGLGDLAAANLTVTPERLEQVDFATPFSDSVRQVVVTGPAGPTIAALDDLAGAEVHVRRSSSFWASLEDLNASFASRGLEPVRVEAAEEFLETEDLLEMVNAGVLPATVADDHIAQFWSGVLDHLTVHAEMPLREGDSIAWAVRKDAPGLTGVVSEFVRENRVGTLTTNVLLNRYLRDNQWVRNPLAGDERKRFEATVELFRTYGDRYDFDHLMLAALAFQESKLDQSVRSRAGAVGVMQIKPETAADPNVGITGIDEMEKNVHAGTKYLGFLRDRYFSDPQLSDRDRCFFTFAAYNAGPARVAKLRAEAAQNGLDPDRWFGNVEVVAARRIGAETVQYVANIAKYYIAYSRAAALEKAG